MANAIVATEVLREIMPLATSEPMATVTTQSKLFICEVVRLPLTRTIATTRR